jgi:monothiol glutaredoxin
MKEGIMSDPVLDEIKKLIDGNKVALFMKGTPEMPRCGFSAGVVEVLRKHNAPFAAMDILPDPRIRQVLSSYSNWPTIPQLFIQGKLIGGCDIVREMDAKGELKPLLDAAAKS